MQLFDVYSLYDIEPVVGHGCYVYDRDNTEYLDLYGGHAVISIGHSHPHYVEAITRQVSKLGFYSNSVLNSLQQTLADLVGRLSGYDDYSLFLCNSGAEANENAVKLASFHTGKAKLLAFSSAFHGRTSGAVAATDNPKIVSPFNNTPHVEFARFGDIADVERHLATGDFCAVIIEGIQGVGGIQVPDDDFLRQLRDLTERLGVVLIVDEIQSGYGRTGRFFAHQYAGIRPDIITCAKGIANGFPMGAVLISPRFTAVKGMLGTTFGGNHLACAAAIAVAEVIENERLVDNAKVVGDYLIERLRELQSLKAGADTASGITAIKDIRGRGLMVGVDIDGSGSEMRKRLLYGHHIFTGGAGVSTVRLLPALCVGKGEIDAFVDAFSTLLD